MSAEDLKRGLDLVNKDRKRTREVNIRNKGRDEDYDPFTKTGDVGTW